MLENLQHHTGSSYTGNKTISMLHELVASKHTERVKNSLKVCVCVCVTLFEPAREFNVVISCYVFLTNRSSRPPWAVPLREGPLSYSPLDKIDLVATLTVVAAVLLSE